MSPLRRMLIPFLLVVLSPITTSFLTSSISRADTGRFTLWTVDRLDMEYYKYREGYRNPYLLDEGATEGGQGIDTAEGYRPMPLVDGAELHVDIDILKYGYWRNRFHMASDQYKHVRYVGWEYEAGVDLARFPQYSLPFEIFEHHHSQHGLEYVNPRGDRFPVEDTYGIRFKFIERQR